MPTIALASYNDKLATELAALGFRVVDGSYMSRPGQAADAYLYTSYRPDADCWFSAHEHGDICLGNYHYSTTSHPATISLNITGLTAEQIALKLRSLFKHSRL